MRSPDAMQTSLFTLTAVEDRVPRNHPLRVVRTVAATICEELRPRLDALYQPSGRAAPPPEQILRALLLWALDGVPSESRLIEELDYNLLYRWFVGLTLDDRIWPRATFTSNRRRVLADPVSGEFFARVLHRIPPRILANPRLSPNRLLLEAWSGQARIPGI